ncbi:MAG: hypothetical protein ACRDZP_03245 [Acidimicrobiales bacterium]
MGTIIGFALGYMMGARGGDSQFEEAKSAWHTLATSAEVRELLSSGSAIAQGLLAEGRDMLAERIKSPTEHSPSLRSVA